MTQHAASAAQWVSTAVPLALRRFSLSPPRVDRLFLQFTTIVFGNRPAPVFFDDTLFDLTSLQFCPYFWLYLFVCCSCLLSATRRARCGLPHFKVPVGLVGETPLHTTSTPPSNAILRWSHGHNNRLQHPGLTLPCVCRTLACVPQLKPPAFQTPCSCLPASLKISSPWRGRTTSSPRCFAS